MTVNEFYTGVQVDILPLPHCVRLPEYKTPGAAAADAYAAVCKPVAVWPGQTAVIPLGFSVAVPEGFTLAVLSRSGLATKGVQIGNCPGVVDPDYRGEVGAVVYNGALPQVGACGRCTGEPEHGRCPFAGRLDPNATRPVGPFVINPGDRICQVAVLPAFRANWNVVESLGATRRGASGFGSTGVGQ